MTSKRNRAACFPTNRRRAVRHRTILPVCFLPYAGYYSTNPACYTPNTHNSVAFLSTVQKLQKRILDFRHFHQKQARNFGFVHILYVFAKELLCVCKRQNRKNTQKYCFCQTLAVRKPQAKQQKYIFWMKIANSGYCSPFMVRAMRFLAVSTLRILTRTISPTFKASRGCLINLSLICEICTSPS